MSRVSRILTIYRTNQAMAESSDESETSESPSEREEHSLAKIHYKVLKPDRYNTFFHPNICHVCKHPNIGMKVIRCHDCAMISYCCKTHMKLDHTYHVDICNAIKKLTREGKMRNFRGGTREEWSRCKRKYVRIVQQELSRVLLPYEEQMLLFARSCDICHRETEHLDICRECLSVNYCHAHNYRERGPHKCEELHRWVNIEVNAISTNRCPKKQKFTCFPYTSEIADMQSFYKVFLTTSREWKTWNLQGIVYSDYLSGPLTLYYGMKDANLLDVSLKEYTYIIHIVTASYTDRLYVQSWEIFLHAFPKRTKLIVIMIGTGLKEECEELQICSITCRSRENTLHFLSHCMLYHDYVSSSLYRKPDVIVGFHVKLSDGETWAQLAPALEMSNCPLLLTAESQVKEQEYISKIKEVLSECVEPVVKKENNFNGSMRHRDCETGDIFCRNKYLIVYKDLCVYDANEPTPTVSFNYNASV